MALSALPGGWLAIVIVWFTQTTHPSFGQYLAKPGELSNWYKTTKANVHFLDSDSNIDSPLGPFDLRLIYCSEYDQMAGTCGGECWVYQGPGSQCMKPNLEVVSCLAATRNVEMCYISDCTDCHTSDTCGTQLEYGFCWTPLTHSINLFVYSKRRLLLLNDVQASDVSKSQ